MSVKIISKAGIEFTFVKKADETMIHAFAPNSELPDTMARLQSGIESVWMIRIWECKNHTTIFDAVCFRGRSFAEKVAREAIRGCFSRLGKRRRLTANKQKREVK